MPLTKVHAVESGALIPRRDLHLKAWCVAESSLPLLHLHLAYIFVSRMPGEIGMIISSRALEPERHHPTLYYDDGNVVLSAYTKNLTSQYFRVHRSILCMHSPVLADMFAIPPLRDDGPTSELTECYDGALHIQMPDTAEDTESFLNVLYDPLCALSFISGRPSTLTFAPCTADLRTNVSTPTLPFSCMEH